MKIAVVGAGAMGSIFGARFARGGHDTVLVDVAAPLVETINADGVTVVRGEEETTTRVPATTDPASVGPVDLVVFFTKCYHTAAAAELGPAARRARHRRRVAAERLGQRRRARGRLPGGADRRRRHLQQRPRPGARPGSRTRPTSRRSSARSPTGRPTTPGPPGSRRRSRDGGLEVSVASPVRPEIWKKLILNAATLPTAALTGMHAGALTAHARDARPRQRHRARGGGRRARRSATTSTRRSASTRSTRCSRRRGPRRRRCCRTSRRGARPRST